MNIEEILNEWRVDSKMDDTKMMDELFKTPMLHSKYLDFYVEMKAKLSVAERKYARMAYLRKRYYRGEMSKDELDKYGWQQYQGLKQSSSEFNQHMDIDPELVDLKEAVSLYKTSVQTCEFILKQIDGRQWTLKSAIEFQKFVAGG